MHVCCSTHVLQVLFTNFLLYYLHCLFPFTPPYKQTSWSLYRKGKKTHVTVSSLWTYMVWLVRPDHASVVWKLRAVRMVRMVVWKLIRQSNWIWRAVLVMGWFGGSWGGYVPYHRTHEQSGCGFCTSEQILIYLKHIWHDCFFLNTWGIQLYVIRIEHGSAPFSCISTLFLLMVSLLQSYDSFIVKIKQYWWRWQWWHWSSWLSVSWPLLWCCWWW